MRKNALTICSCTCAVGAFGAFFRWLQNQICYDAETGIMARGAFNILIPLVMLGAAVAFYIIIKKFFDGDLVPPAKLYEVFHGTTLIFPIIFLLISAITVLGGIITIANVRFEPQSGLYIAVGISAVLCGIGFPLICTCAQNRYSPGFVSVLMSAPILMFSVWLMASYRKNATIPSVWIYAIEIIAICACIAAFFFTSGYAYGRVSPVKSLLSTMFAAFMCFMTLADSRYTGLQFIVCGSAGMLLIENWLIISNSRPKAEIASPEESDESFLPPDLDDIIEEATSEAEEVTVADEDDDVKIWKKEK